jgi:hypothetical protein
MWFFIVTLLMIILKLLNLNNMTAKKFIGHVNILKIKISALIKKEVYVHIYGAQLTTQRRSIDIQVSTECKRLKFRISLWSEWSAGAERRYKVQTNDIYFILVGHGYFSWYSNEATGWTTRKLESDSQQEKETVFFSIMSLESIQPPIQWILGASFLRSKAARYKTDHSLPSSDKVKNA